jgi:ferrochelatase
VKTAVVLLNLGGPLREADIRPFLFNFFRDRNVITLPNPFRFLLAAWISSTRSRGAAKKSYGELGGKSPLLENTQRQAKALQEALGGDMRVFTCMRHWHPMSDEVVKEVSAWAPERVVLLPLYPQYSTTTTLSALEDWRGKAQAAGLPPAAEICCYPIDGGFISASAALIAAEMKKAQGPVRLLFSAHGLPEKIVRKGDPYQQHCEQSALLIAQALGVQDWQMCYQSRVGRLKWIGPSIDEALVQAMADKVGVAVYPVSFVSEHVETLVELDLEYRHRAEELGIETYLRVPTVGTHPQFIAGLRDLVLSSLAGENGRNCPAGVACHRGRKYG